MAVDINAVKKAAEKGATVPVLSNLLSKFGISKADADQAAKNIVEGDPVEEAIQPFPTTGNGGMGAMTMMVLAGVAFVAIMMVTQKGKRKRR